MRFIQVAGPKGGVGTSTVATVIALKAYQQGNRTLLIDAGPRPSIEGLIGNPYYMDTMRLDGGVPDNIVVDDDWDVIVLDSGLNLVDDGNLATIADSTNYVHVLRNEYLALRHYLHDSSLKFAKEPTHLVTIVNEKNALTKKDVDMVVSRETIKFPFSEKVARTVDAGLLTTRLYIEEFGWADEMLAKEKV